MAPGTEFARDFCAGIGPLQLGVVLVSITFFWKSLSLPLNCVLRSLISYSFGIEQNLVTFPVYRNGGISNEITTLEIIYLYAYIQYVNISIPNNASLAFRKK